VTGFISNNAAKAACDAIVDRLDLGTGAALLRIYAGSVPADADAALGAQTLLAELTMSDPAFGAAADLNPGARATASAISDDTSANATGTATFFRMVQSDGTSEIQGACAVSGSELNFNSTAISSGAIVSVTSFTVTVPES
jgi:hypothetical protein